MPLKKRSAPNSMAFLEMIAKTIDRDRKTQEFNEMIKNKKMMLEKNYASNNKKIFQMRSMKNTRENIPKKHAIKTINELLYYVEKTRPRIWLKDVVDDTKIHDIQIESQTTKNRYNQTSESKVRPKKRLVSPPNPPKLGYERSSQLIFEKHRSHLGMNLHSCTPSAPLTSQIFLSSKRSSPKSRKKTRSSIYN
jgi:hypothetical protein